MPRPRRIVAPVRINAGIRFSEALYGRLRHEAERRRVSVNRLVEWAVEDWLNGRHSKSR